MVSSSFFNKSALAFWSLSLLTAIAPAHTRIHTIYTALPDTSTRIARAYADNADMDGARATAYIMGTSNSTRETATGPETRILSATMGQERESAMGHTNPLWTLMIQKQPSWLP